MDAEIRGWLHRERDDEEAISALEEMIESFGRDAMNAWKDESNRHKHRLVHLLALNGWARALDRVAWKHSFDINVQRDSDLCTAAHLAIWHHKRDVLNKLWELKADTSLKNKYGESADQKWTEEREKYDYLVFLDLEFTKGHHERDTHFHAKILEAALIITDKDLNEKARGQWVIGQGFSKGELEGLGEFHQKHFRDAGPGGEFPPLAGAEHGGNGLFSEVLKSFLSTKDVEDAMLALVKANCPEHACPLVGYSVHCDREVLKSDMPRLYAYMSHQILDLSTVLRLATLWLPEKMEHRLRTTYQHRALHDTEESVETLHWIRDNLFRQPETVAA